MTGILLSKGVLAACRAALSAGNEERATPIFLANLASSARGKPLLNEQQPVDLELGESARSGAGAL